MTSLRHKPQARRGPGTEEAALDAARAAILDVGWSRTTLTDIARRAGLSRMTLYRRWPDMQSLLADLMTREWAGLVAAGSGATARDQVVDGIVDTARAIRANPLFARIIELDPELLLPYLLDRPGRSQDLVVDMLTTRIAAGQSAGVIRAGDAALLARTVVLAAHGFVLSAHTMATGPTRFDDELRTLLDRYLAP